MTHDDQNIQLLKPLTAAERIARHNALAIDLGYRLGRGELNAFDAALDEQRRRDSIRYDDKGKIIDVRA